MGCTVWPEQGVQFVPELHLIPVELNRCNSKIYPKGIKRFSVLTAGNFSAGFCPDNPFLYRTPVIC